MHIVLLNQPFYPDVVATAQMAKDLADTLAARGHTVTAVASRSIYGRQGATLPPFESIRVGPGQINIHRVGASIFGKKGIAARLADFALFYVLATFKVLTLKKPDVIVCFTTPPFIALVGLLCRALRGTKAVHWVMDLYPDVAVSCDVMKPNGVMTRVLDSISRFILNSSDSNVVLGRCMRDRVLAKGTPPAKVELIQVWADLAGLEPVAHNANPYRARWAPANEFLVMYSGNYGLGHDADTLLDAMRILKDEPGLRFAFVGSGKRRAQIEHAIKDLGLTNAHWYDYVPREQLGQSLSAADLHLISVKEGCEGTVVPSKLFGIMAVARPSIYIGSPTSEVARILSESDSGVLIREGKGEELAATIRALKSDAARRATLGANAARAIKGVYDRETLCTRWATLLESFVPGAPAAPSPTVKPST